MKPLYVVVIAGFTALLGFFAGGGLGFFGGSIAGTVAGAGMGSCAATNVAVEQKLITPAQADQLATAIGAKLHATNPDLQLAELDVHGKNAAENGNCGEFLAKVRAGFEAAK